jgi:hypothetical protein
MYVNRVEPADTKWYHDVDTAFPQVMVGPGRILLTVTVVPLSFGYLTRLGDGIGTHVRQGSESTFGRNVQNRGSCSFTKNQNYPPSCQCDFIRGLKLLKQGTV